VTPPTSPGPSATAPVGRPRSGGRQRPGGTPREEILDAAAELFTSRGYAATSTRTIADAVGVRQASLYYHFTSKEELLEELLAGTVQPSLAFAAALEAGTESPERRLFSLAAYDTGLLCGGRWNLGALYLLPEVRGERFEQFRKQRDELRAAYVTLIRALIPAAEAAEAGKTGEAAEELTDLVFGLVESVITIRSEREIVDVDATAQRVAAGCLRLVGVPAHRIAALAER
jgi:AcrR family transcriptional regulator